MNIIVATGAAPQDTSISYSLFDTYKADPRPVTATWSAFAAQCAQPREYASKAACPLVKLATFGESRSAKGSLRHDANVTAVYGIEGDIDGGATVADVRTKLAGAGIEALLVTTPSHTPEAPRMRVFAPLSAPCAPADRRRWVALLNAVLDGVLAVESFAMSQSFYVGRVQGVPYEWHHVAGEAIDASMVPMMFEPLYPADSRSASPAAVGEGLDSIDGPELPAPPLDVIRAALDAIPNDDKNQLTPDWHGFRKIAVAVWHGTDGSDAGRDALFTWARRNPRFDEAQTVDVWERADRSAGEHITIASLLHIAKGCGWHDPRVTKASDDVHAAIVTRIDAGGDPRSLVRDTLRDLADSDLPAADEDGILRRLKTATGTALGALRQDLDRARRKVQPAGEAPPATHHGYAVAYLADLTRQHGGHEAVGVEGNLYTVAADGIWQAKTLQAVAGEVARRYDGMEKCERVTDYSGIARHAYAMAEQEVFFEGAPVGLACPTGFYRVSEAGSIDCVPLHADHRQRHMHAASPKPGPMPLFERFIEETFRSDNRSESRDQVDRVQEVFGAVALGLLARHEKVVLFYGPGRSGKGTVAKILEAAVPADGRISVPPHRWDSEYYVASLAGHRLNVVGELPDGEPIPAAVFKTVTGRDMLTGRHPTGRPFSFRSEVAHVFSSNHYVSTRDHTEAFYSRWLIVGFLNSRIGGGKIETDLAERMVRDELPAILNWALEGAARLVRRGHFAPTAVHDRLMAAWRRRTDSLMEFLHDEDVCHLQATAKPGVWASLLDRVKRTEMYAAYSAWCSRSGRKSIGKQKFYDELETPGVQALGVKVTRSRDEREIVQGVRLAQFGFAL